MFPASSAYRKCLAEFAARRRRIEGIMFCRGVYLAEHTSRGASVEWSAKGGPPRRRA